MKSTTNMLAGAWENIWIEQIRKHQANQAIASCLKRIRWGQCEVFSCRPPQSWIPICWDTLSQKPPISRFSLWIFSASPQLPRIKTGVGPQLCVGSDLKLTSAASAEELHDLAQVLGMWKKSAMNLWLRLANFRYALGFYESRAWHLL